jgi:hypothetical protein
MTYSQFKHRHEDGEVETVAIADVPTEVLQQSGTRLIFEILTHAGALLDIDEELRKRGNVNRPPHFIQVLFEAAKQIREAGDAPPANTLPV